jgi:hypothetical protein
MVAEGEFEELWKPAKRVYLAFCTDDRGVMIPVRLRNSNSRCCRPALIDSRISESFFTRKAQRAQRFYLCFFFSFVFLVFFVVKSNLLQIIRFLWRIQFGQFRPLYATYLISSIDNQT